MLRTFNLDTTRNGLFEIKEQIQQAVADSGADEGIAVGMVPHTTAGVTMVSFPDSACLDDVNEEVSRLITIRNDFKHQVDTPHDAAGHIKAVLIGASFSLIISGGKLLLGSSQSIYFFEFDGPRNREVNVKIIAG